MRRVTFSFVPVVEKVATEVAAVMANPAQQGFAVTTQRGYSWGTNGGPGGRGGNAGNPTDGASGW